MQYHHYGCPSHPAVIVSNVDTSSRLVFTQARSLHAATFLFVSLSFYSFLVRPLGFRDWIKFSKWLTVFLRASVLTANFAAVSRFPFRVAFSFFFFFFFGPCFYGLQTGACSPCQPVTLEAHGKSLYGNCLYHRAKWLALDSGAGANQAGKEGDKTPWFSWYKLKPGLETQPWSPTPSRGITQ